MIETVAAEERARILIVDDNEDFAANLQELAAFAGHEATIAGNVAEAEARLRRQGFDVAVIDQRLPDGNGVDLMTRVQASQPDVVAVIVTAFASLENTISALNAGAFAFVTKDSDPELLFDAVERAVENARLKSENRRLRVTQDGILDAIPDLLMLVDGDLYVVSVNRDHAVFCPMTPGRGARIDIQELLSPLVRERIDWVGLIRTATERNGPAETSLTVRDPVAGSRYYSVRCSPLPGPRRQVLVQIADLSERIGLERRLAESEGMAVLGRLTSVIAHEIRNPLTGIRALAQLLHKHLPQDHQDRENVAEMLALADRMGATLQDLLTYAKPQVAKDEHVPIRALLDDVAREARRWPACEARTIEVCHERDDDPEVFGERARLFSALSNLTENALQAVPEHGVVRLRLAGDAHRCEVHVEDSGPGIADADLPRLFEPFFSRRKGGTGLGLAIVKKAVDALGGDITAGASASLGGARFSVGLPLVVQGPRAPLDPKGPSGAGAP